MKIAIAGLGTVGVGVYKILQDKRDVITKRAGDSISVVAVSSRSKSKDRGVTISDNVRWYNNPLDIASDDNVDIVIETIGGEDGVAYLLCKESLQNSKHVVTANKALIAKHGAELSEIANKNNVGLYFEAAVAGGIPILKILREGLSANGFNRVLGILNGTCNYILTEMEQKGLPFDEVLADAQAKGYAETPPDLDIDGIDTAHKLAIISSLAYGSKIDFDSISVTGIRNISLEDINFAKEMGYKIKLIAESKMLDSGLLQSVEATLLPKDSPIANVDGVTNAALIYSDAMGECFVTGAGAGELPTASSVVADIIDIAAGRISPAFYDAQQLKVADINSSSSKFYLRFNTFEGAGILAEITAILSRHEISVDKVIQNHDGEKASIAMITCDSPRKNVVSALLSLTNLDILRSEPQLLVVSE